MSTVTVGDSMRRLMERLSLTVNDRKTRIACVPAQSFDFLGYTVGRFYGKEGRAGTHGAE